MARTNKCKECGTTDGPWVGTNHNLCKPCADARPAKAEIDRAELARPEVTARTMMIAAMMAGIMPSPKRGRK